MSDLDRDVGALEARMDALEKRLERMEPKLDQLVQWMQQSKGGIRTLIAVGSIAGAVGAALAKAFALIKGGTP